jgi:hypothetical protein
MTKLTEMEKQLAELDKTDEQGGAATNWRLRGTFDAERLDSRKMDLLSAMEKEALAYGMMEETFRYSP